MTKPTDLEFGYMLLRRHEHEKAVQRLIARVGRDSAAVELAANTMAKNKHIRKHVVASQDALSGPGGVTTAEDIFTDGLIPVKEEFRLDALAPYDPEKGFSQQDAMINALSTGWMNQGLDLIDAATSPREVVGGMVDLGGGIASLAAGPFTDKPLYPAGEEAVWGLAEAGEDFFSDPRAVGKFMQERPNDIIAGVGGARPLAALSGLKRTATGMRTMNPVANVPRAAMAVSRGVGGAATPLSATTGVGITAMKEAWESGVEGGSRGRRFREGIRTWNQEDRAKALLDRFTGSFDELRSLRGERYREALKGLQKTKNLDIGLANVRIRLRKFLEEYGVGFTEGKRHPVSYEDFGRAGTPQAGHRRSQRRPAIQTSDVAGQIKFDGNSFARRFRNATDQQLIRDAVELIETWNHTSVVGMDQLKKELWDLVPSGKLTPAGKAVQAMSRNVRGVLNKGVKGYEKMTTEFAEMSELMDQLSFTMSLQTGTKEFTRSFGTVISKLDGLMSDNADYARWLVQTMEDITGQKFLPTMAGMSMRGTLPASLTGRSNIVAGIKSAAMGALSLGAAGGVNPAFLLTMPFFSPKLVGEFYHLMGRARGVPKRINKRISGGLMELHGAIEKKYPRLAKSGYTLGQIISAVSVEDALLYNSMLHQITQAGEDNPKAMPLEEVPDMLGEFGSDAYKMIRAETTPFDVAAELIETWKGDLSPQKMPLPTR